MSLWKVRTYPVSKLLFWSLTPSRVWVWAVPGALGQESSLGVERGRVLSSGARVRLLPCPQQAAAESQLVPARPLPSPSPHLCRNNGAQCPWVHDNHTAQQAVTSLVPGGLEGKHHLLITPRLEEGRRGPGSALGKPYPGRWTPWLQLCQEAQTQPFVWRPPGTDRSHVVPVRDHMRVVHVHCDEDPTGLDPPLASRGGFLSLGVGPE